MPHPAIAPNVAQEPGEEGVVADGRAVAHHRNVLPRPGDGNIHAPAISQEADGAESVRPNLPAEMRVSDGNMAEEPCAGMG